MLKIKNRYNKTSSIYCVDPDTNVWFEPGQIAQLLNPMPRLAAVLGLSARDILTVSGGRAPIGIIDDIRNQNDDTTVATGKIAIWHVDSLEFETDQYESAYFYTAGMSLYCSKNGKFSPIPFFSGSPIVGQVVSYPGAVTSTGILHGIWKQPNYYGNVSNTIAQPGLYCSKCKDYNQYAQTNQPDGTYKCWGCRH